jgi:hypothetical protein
LHHKEDALACKPKFPNTCCGTGRMKEGSNGRESREEEKEEKEMIV